MITIKFPSPTLLNHKDWFEQMELSLFHAKKAYDKFVKNIPGEKLEDVSIRFNYPEMEKNKKFSNLCMSEEMSYEDTQEIEFVIDY